VANCKKKIINVLCTLGPASLNRATIKRLEERGVDLFRINLSHTPLESVAATIETIQALSLVPICLDTEGAQVRTGNMADQVHVSEAEHVRLEPNVALGNARLISLTPASVFTEMQPNNLIGLDFDGVVLLVLRVDERGADTVVLNGGNIGSNKAVVITPSPQLLALSDKDRQAIQIGRRYGISHYALSFANSAEDVKELRELAGPDSTIISKIESKRGVLNLDEILEASDEILIDRGDLSREVPLENIPMLQKAIIRKATLAKKPVNVATNLLESMIVNRKPTRAELNDILNTLLDGASGLVLAAETAIGKHPVESVDIVLSMIERFRCSLEGYRIEDLLNAGQPSYPALDGRMSLDWGPSRQRSGIPAACIPRLPGIEIDEETALDIEQIAQGVYSPLRGFMTEAELESVLDNYCLPNGDIWTLPILLQSKCQEFAAIQPGQSVRLIDQRTGQSIAILHVQDKYEIDPQNVARRWFGTADKAHLGAARLIGRDLTMLGGPIEYLDRPAIDRSPYELTPTQTRMIFDIKGWTKIVAFQSRNVPHRGHEHIITNVCDRCHADGVLLHPAIGPQMSDGFSANAILGAYERLIRLAFPNALLAAFSSYPRYSGPREAVFSALCRKNFGCTHFVLGRNNAGADGVHRPDSNRELFDSLGDIGITPVFFDTVYFSDTDGATVESQNHTAGLREISGTRIRDMLANRESVPPWCMRDELSDWLVDEQDAGAKLFKLPR
jgi:pyruvate kinase